MAVILAATSNGAKAAGADEEMGTIETGKLANLVVLQANPLDDVRNLRSVVLTVKRGRAFPRSEYRPVSKR
jgi:imidazolonepropionase-like amidohydrolase